MTPVVASASRSPLDRTFRSRRRSRRQARPGSTASFLPRSPHSAVAASARRSARQWTAGSIISSNRIWLGGKGSESSSPATSSTLRRRELDEAASKLSAQTGLAHRPCAEGEHVSGICRQRVTLASGRFVMIDDGLGFQLVTWRSALEQRLGQQVSGTLTPGGGIDWSFQRKRGLGNRHRLMKPLAHFGPSVGLSRHRRNPTPPGRSSLPWGICRTTSRCAAS